MADKMMRVAGRNPNGVAKAFNTDLFGNLKIQDSVDSTQLNSGNITINPGQPRIFDNQRVPKVYTISGRITSSDETLRVGVSDYFASSAGPAEIQSVEVKGGRFVTKAIMANADKARIAIIADGSSDLVVSHLFINSVAQLEPNGGSSNLTIKDMEGNDIELTAEKDHEGKGVLRVVDAAPHAYDETSDLIKVAQVNDVLTPHITKELVWLEPTLTGTILYIQLDGNKDLLRGKKGFIFYQGIDDNHDIYFRYRIGGSGDYVRDFIVQNGTGAEDKENVKVPIPDECFPFIDFSGTSQDGKSTSELVFEARSGDLTQLRAYITLMG